MCLRNIDCKALGWKLLVVCVASSIFTDQASSTLTIPSTNVTYPSLPALYYGKSWSSSTTTVASIDNHTTADPTITVDLQYFDIDYCNELGKVEDPNDTEHIFHRSPIKSYVSRIEPATIFDSHNNTDSDKQEQQHLQQQQQQSLPIALLVQDQYGRGYIKNRPCHLIDYERLAIAWNVSYIIFYDESKDAIDDEAAEDQPLLWYEQSQGYLDSPILSETNSIGFQLVSYATGVELISLIDDKSGGIVIELDGIIEQPDDSIHNDEAPLQQELHPQSPPPRFGTSQIHYRKLLALVPMASGILSFLGSSYIVYSLVGTKIGRTKQLQTTFHRLLLALSISDMISSFGTSLSQWVFPQEAFPGIDPEWHNFVYPYASGTNNTCSLQGFLVQLGFHGSVLFTGFISIQYVLTVRYAWKQERLRKLEMAFFGVGIVIPLSTAITLLSLDAYHPKITGICWAAVNPYFCKDSYVGWCHENKTWGENMGLTQWLTALGWIGLTFVIIIVSMVLLFLTVRAQETRSARWSPSGSERRTQMAVVKLASSYLGAYVFIWLCFALMHARHDKLNANTSILPVLVGAILPMQGILNVLIYSKKYQLIWYLFPCCCDPPQAPSQETSFNNERFGRGNTMTSSFRMKSTSRIVQLQERNLPWLSKFMLRQQQSTPASPPSSTEPPLTEPGSSRAMEKEDTNVNDRLHASGFFTV